MKNKRTPEIRFAGFTDAWEQRNVGEYLKESRISGSNGSEAKKLTVKLWGKGIVPKKEIYQGSEATKYFVRKSGQFMYGKLDFINQAFGIVPNELEGYESTLDLPAFDISKELNGKFFLEYVSRKDFYQYQGMIANGSRKAKRIHEDTFSEMPLVLPNKEEQEKIASFFTNLDHLITLHQRELTTLKQTKQGFLQKMFPSEGETVPEVRFPGFTGDWEQRELGEISDFITKGATPTTYGFNWEESGIPFFRNDSIKDNRFVFGEYSYISEEASATLIRSEIRCNDILIAITGDIGKVGIVPKCIEKANINQHMAKVRILKDAHPYFVYQYLSIDEMQKKYQKIKTGLSMPQLSLEQIRETIVKLPSREEQKKIGVFFKNLDNLITFHQRELDYLEETKKAFLQKMFV